MGDQDMKKMMVSIWFCSFIGLAPFYGYPHDGDYPSIHDTVAAIQERLAVEYSPDRLISVSAGQLLSYMTEQEKEILSNGHIRFSVNVPVTVYVIRDRSLGDQPFWLKERGFIQTGDEVTVDEDRFDIWKKDFPAQRIGLGINSLSDEGEQYLIAVAAQNPTDDLKIESMYPGQCRLARLERGQRAYIDDDAEIERLPSHLNNLTLIQTSEDWNDDANLENVFKTTRFPSGPKPDQIVLTWSGDPTTTQTIQWRTSPAVAKGVVAYIKKSDYHRFDPKQPTHVEATTQVLKTLDIVNDPICHRHSVTLENLEPDTEYLYSVGDGTDEGWSEMAEFKTAPDGIEPFSFIYMGDAQNGLDRWGTLIQTAFRERPDAAFYIMAGDLVNRGIERWDWDDFFYNAESIFDRRTLVPAIGNHEDQGEQGPWLYLELFDLPKNGPETIPKERAYAFKYSNALFVVLDSNLEPKDQAEWLEKKLADTDATWKFVVYHHPAYSSSPGRDNPEIREYWTPLFDKYHVDLALQGHDHAYLRTYPMKDNQIVQDPKDGTIYLITVSGTKMYEQGDHDYTAFGMTNVSTYQVLDIQIIGDRLVYRAYDIDGKLRDEIVIEK